MLERPFLAGWLARECVRTLTSTVQYGGRGIHHQVAGNEAG